MVVTMTIDAFVYLAILPSLVLCFFALVYLHYVRKHDRVLFRFCQIRRDMMSLLRERGTELSKEDYAALRFFLKGINNLVQRYSVHKFKMFNARAFVAWVRNNAKLLEESAAIPESDDKEIQALQLRTTIAIALGFFAYTRFLRFEVMAKFLAHLAKLFARFGSGVLKKYGDKALWTLNQVALIQEHRPVKQSQ